MNPWGALVLGLGVLLVYLGVKGNYRHALTLVTGQ